MKSIAELINDLTPAQLDYICNLREDEEPPCGGSISISNLIVDKAVELDLGDDFHQALNNETVVKCLEQAIPFFDAREEDDDSLRIDGWIYNYKRGRYTFIDGMGNKVILSFVLIKGRNGYFFHTLNDLDDKYILYILS